MTMTLVSKSQVRDELRRQIAEKEAIRKQARQEDIEYGARLNLMARSMHKRDQEMHNKQREMQFK
jgi:hypothetical protein